MRADQDRWDERYRPALAATSAEGAGVGGDASPRVESASPLLQRLLSPDSPLPVPRGQALDLACGLGRNAFLLARSGFEVTAVDISPVGLEVVQARARTQGLSVQTVQADLDAYPLPPETYALVVCSLFLDRSLFHRIPLSLLPGGWVYYEALLRDEALPGGEGGSSAFRLDPGELLTAFLAQGLRVYAYLEGLEAGKPTAQLLARRVR